MGGKYLRAIKRQPIPDGKAAFRDRRLLAMQGLHILLIRGRIVQAQGMNSSTVEMQPAFVGDKAIQEASRQMAAILVNHQAKSNSGFWGCAFMAGCLLLLIPVIGWIIGAVLIALSIIGFFSPVIAYRIVDAKEYNKLIDLVNVRARNAFVSVTCPHCKTPWTKSDEAYCFDSDPEGLDCDYCKKRIIRNGDRLSLI
jgi:hypothetical protein